MGIQASRDLHINLSVPYHLINDSDLFLQSFFHWKVRPLKLLMWIQIPGMHVYVSEQHDWLLWIQHHSYWLIPIIPLSQLYWSVAGLKYLPVTALCLGCEAVGAVGEAVGRRVTVGPLFSWFHLNFKSLRVFVLPRYWGCVGKKSHPKAGWVCPLL